MKLWPHACAWWAFAAMAACASTQIVPMDHGTFLVSKRSAQAHYGPPLDAREDVYHEAGQYCARQGKGVETVSLDIVDSHLGRPGNASLQFKCVAGAVP